MRLTLAVICLILLRPVVTAQPEFELIGVVRAPDQSGLAGVTVKVIGGDFRTTGNSGEFRIPISRTTIGRKVTLQAYKKGWLPGNLIVTVPANPAEDPVRITMRPMHKNSASKSISKTARDDSRRALMEATAENLSIRSARFNDDYPTTFRRAFCFRCMMPSPAIVGALWEVTVINNDQRDVSLIEYEVAPIQGVFEQYDHGLFDTTTGKTFRLPVNVPSGHAVRFRVRSLLVLPPDVATKLESDGPFPRELPSLSYLFNRLYSLNIDCFGNRVWGGPGGYNLEEYDSPNLKDQQLRLTIRSGRGSAITHTLTWYGPLQDGLPSHGRLPWPQRPVSMPVKGQ